MTNVGDEVVVTILGQVNMKKTETREEKRKRIIESDLYVASSGRTVEETFYLSYLFQTQLFQDFANDV